MVRVLLAGMLVLVPLMSGVTAQEPYPTRPVTIVSPYPPGAPPTSPPGPSPQPWSGP